MPKVFTDSRGIRDKNIRARTTKTVRNNMVSIGGLLMAAILLIIGFAAFSAGFTNVGSIFVLLGGFVLILSLLPVLGLPGWVLAIVAIVGLIVVIAGSLPFMDAIVGEAGEFIDDLPNYILEWLFPGV